VLWPENLQQSVNQIREHLTERFKHKYIGVIITDMAAIPLQKGLLAGPIAYSGFAPFKNLTGTPDVFGRIFKYSWEGHLQGLAAAAGVVMGEGAEQTPIGIITDIPFLTFQSRNPTRAELNSLKMAPDEDMYGQMIEAVKWEKGNKK
jgi:F420-0:gamma-glutamyl ligase